MSAANGGRTTWRARVRAAVRRRAPHFVVAGLIVLFLCVFFFDRVFVSIYPGQLGVLWRRLGAGTVLDTVYQEGLHVILPINRMYVYDTRRQQLGDEIDVLTLDGLTVHLRYTVRYYLDRDSLPLLHQRVGPDYVNVVVKPDVRAVIRTVFGQYRPEEIYTSQRAIQERVSEQAKLRLSARFIALDDVPLEAITLPARISQAIEDKMVQQQTEGAYVYRTSIARKEAERLKIESEGLRTYHEVIDRSLTPAVLSWRGILATEELAKSPNAKTVVIGAGKSGLPLILGKD